MPHATTMLIWVSGCIALLMGWWSFDHSPGAPAMPPERSPFSVQRPTPQQQRSQILVFLDPDCACSQATVSQLADAIQSFRDLKPAVRLILMGPQEAVFRYQSATQKQGSPKIPAAEVVADPQGTQARQFGVRTSGTVVVYDTQGRLRFHGGITSARGVVGPNPSLTAFFQSLKPEHGRVSQLPVFGCASGVAKSDWAQNSIR